MRIKPSDLKELKLILENLTLQTHELEYVCIKLYDTPLKECDEMRKNIQDLNDHACEFFDLAMRIVVMLSDYYWNKEEIKKYLNYQNRITILENIETQYNFLNFK